MNNFKRLAITLIGGLLLVIGILFIVLPGPAILFIPAGLALLASEYAIARVWLKKYQRYSRQAATKADQTLSRLRDRSPGFKAKCQKIIQRFGRNPASRHYSR
jgi:hypothetical protein